MITKEQIEKAAKHYSFIWDESDAFVAGAEWALEQCPYSKEDMMSFVEWVDKGLWTIYNSKWYNSTSPKGDNMITTDELLKLWEEQK